MSNEFPRRNRLYELQPAEKAIWDAMQAVEAMPADPRLTLAINQLKGAASSVADFIDGTPGETPAAPNGPESDKLDQAMNELKSWAGEYCADSDCEYGNDMAMGRHSKFCGMLTGAIADIKDGIRELRGTPTPEAQGAAPTGADLDSEDAVSDAWGNVYPRGGSEEERRAFGDGFRACLDQIRPAPGAPVPAPAPTWTREKPTVSGWYWYKEPFHDEPAIPAEVDVEGNCFTLFGINGQNPLSKNSPNNKWAGPIPSPLNPSETGKGVSHG